MTVIDMLEGVNTLLWIEYVAANFLLILSNFVSFQVCFYITVSLIFMLNGVVAIKIGKFLEQGE